MEHKILNDEAVLICSKALETFGTAIQKVVAMEECAELISAINYKMMGEENNIEEEIADVEIMCTQLEIMFNTGSTESYQVQWKCSNEESIFNIAIMLLTRLQSYISKTLRGIDNKLNRPIGEVIGICKQLRTIFNEDEINKIKQQKLKRLRGLVW